MSNSVVVGIGVAIIIAGVVIVFSSGADLSNLPLNDFTARLGNAEITATDISPEAQTTIMSGFVVSIIGILVMATGAKIN